MNAILFFMLAAGVLALGALSLLFARIFGQTRMPWPLLTIVLLILTVFAWGALNMAAEISAAC